MVSEGGIAGAGETLRRVLWRDLQVDGDEVLTTLDPAQNSAIEPVAKDEWPAR